MADDGGSRREQSDPSPMTLFHIIKEQSPSRADFLSGKARGTKQPSDLALIPYWQGISFESTLEGARRKAMRFPKLGAYVAEVGVGRIAGVQYEPSFAPGHFTVWAEPDECLANVMRAYPVDEKAEG